MDGVNSPAISPTVEPTLPQGVQHHIKGTREQVANSGNEEPQEPKKRGFDSNE